MSKVAEQLIEAFYNRPLPEYRSAIWEVRESGGLTEADQALIEERAEPLDATTILRQADPMHMPQA